MPPLQLPRRRLLSGGTAILLSALAGCSSDDSVDTPRDPRSGPPENAVTDLETVSVRRDSPDPFVGLDDSTGVSFLVESADRDTLAFDVEPPGTDEARAFVAKTDFETQAVGVFQAKLGACHRRHIEYLVSREGYVEAEFCRILRDGDVACETSDRDMVATFVRFPYPHDTTISNARYGSGSSCDSAHWTTEGGR